MQYTEKVDASNIHELLSALYERGGSITPDSMERAMRLLRSSMDTIQSLRLTSEIDINLSQRVSKIDKLRPVSYAEIYHKVNLIVSDADVFASHLRPYKRVYGNLIAQVVGQYCWYADAVLEIGCGGFPLVAIASKNFPLCKGKPTLSDVRPQVVKLLKEQYPEYLSEQMDLLDLSSTRSPNSQDLILMGSVLDTLTIEQMKKAFKEMYRCLKPGGVMIHFAPRSSFPSSTTHDYASHDLVVFPVIDEERNWTSIKVVKKSELLEKIKGLNPITDRLIIEPLMAFLELAPIQRDTWCHEMITSNNRYQVIFLTQSLDKLKCRDVKTVNFWDALRERLEIASKLDGTSILYHGDHEEVYIGERSDERHFENPAVHQFILSRGNYYENYLGVLAPGNIQEVMRCHVFVWQKIN